MKQPGNWFTRKGLHSRLSGIRPAHVVKLFDLHPKSQTKLRMEHWEDRSARKGLHSRLSSYRPRQVAKLSVHGPLVLAVSTLSCQGSKRGFESRTGRHVE